MAKYLDSSNSQVAFSQCFVVGNLRCQCNPNKQDPLTTATTTPLLFKPHTLWYLTLVVWYIILDLGLRSACELFAACSYLWSYWMCYFPARKIPVSKSTLSSIPHPPASLPPSVPPRLPRPHVFLVVKRLDASSSFLLFLDQTITMQTAAECGNHPSHLLLLGLIHWTISLSDCFSSLMISVR